MTDLNRGAGHASNSIVVHFALGAAFNLAIHMPRAATWNRPTSIQLCTQCHPPPLPPSTELPDDARHPVWFLTGWGEEGDASLALPRRLYRPTFLRL